ncbi:rho GTPase-activating protein 29-like [Sturnira hondurensis]|uniref:rho GTPase-activating protein 29-like n=1 Tax=Sturnira hondurensis TaxID=192404 RepID=UPI001879DEE3|nr:rho GTPase-activating protein 29-like [Sturnira hondurensis]
MSSGNLGVIFGPSLIRRKPTSAPVTISALAEYSHQALMVKFLITYSQRIFDGSLKPQDVAMCTTGNVAPQADHACHLKSLLSPEERDPEHSTKSLFFSSKEDMPIAEAENQSLHSVASLEESAGKQNASEKGDACLPGEWSCEILVC